MPTGSARGDDAPDLSEAGGARHADTGAAEVRRQLESISETLADLAIAALRDALDSGETALGARAERRLTRARRAVEKAVALLAEPEPGD